MWVLLLTKANIKLTTNPRLHLLLTSKSSPPTTPHHHDLLLITTQNQRSLTHACAILLGLFYPLLRARDELTFQRGVCQQIVNRADEHRENLRFERLTLLLWFVVACLTLIKHARTHSRIKARFNIVLNTI